MNRLLKSALLELRSDGVILDSVDDLEHILTLDKLSIPVQRSGALSDRIEAAPAFKIGSFTFKRLSIGAQRFVSSRVLEWFSDDVWHQDLSYAFCMANADNPEILWAYHDDREGFKKVVKAWGRLVPCTMQVLRDSIRAFLDSGRNNEEIDRDGPELTPRRCLAALDTLNRLTPIPEPLQVKIKAAIVGIEQEAREDSGGYGPLIEILCAEYGGTPEQWLWRTSAREIGILLSARTERKEAEARGKSGHNDSRMLRAHHAFHEYIEFIRRMKKEKQK